jgi:nucleotide-binding universal stress UspA family protein
VSYARILVPLDGSDLALAAIPTARALARHFGAELHAISVARDAADVDRLHSKSMAALELDHGDDRAAVVVGGKPDEMIARRASELESCLVCLSTRARGRLGGAVFGSIARSLLRDTGGAIVALGPLADRPGWLPRPAIWPEPLSVPRIVACVDGTAASENVLPTASGWARALGMSLTIVTSIDDAPWPTRSEHRRYGSESNPERYLERLVNRWSATCAVDGQIITDPISPASGIRDHLAKSPASLVAVSTHARSGLSRVLHGANAASIVRASTAPCLVVPN